MVKMEVDRLKQVTAKLEAHGLDVSKLRSLEVELAVNERPPGFLGRLGGQAKEILHAQWVNLRGEAGETREAFVLLVRRIREKKPMAPEEADKVKAQLIDLVKILPAGVFAAANAALPIPGTSWLTPMLLCKMGLMPRGQLRDTTTFGSPRAPTTPHIRWKKETHAR